EAIWSFLTSVNVAVAQILVLALMAVVGMTIRQLPSFALLSPSDYAIELAKLHDRYDPLFGAAVVDVLDRLDVFHVFSSWWFSLALVLLLVSIVACTIDRTPRLWRDVADVRVVQPEAYFDPRLPNRAATDGIPIEALRSALRRRRFRLREAEAAGVRYVYGDRNQYTRLATLLTHTGLVLFLVAAAVTTKLGLERGLAVPIGDTQTVQSIGTPDLLVVKNYDFEAPGLDTGQASDFSTDLGVFQNGREIARKTIRVNDPLSVAGFTFHQNGFGPAPDLLVSDSNGRPLWSGPVPLTDSVGDVPVGTLDVPGRPAGLQLFLDRAPDGSADVVILPYVAAPTATDPNGVATGVPVGLAPGASAPIAGTDFSVAVRSISAYTVLIAKNDPGQGIVWLAFGSLIAGIVITFYLPRRRVWARLLPDGRLALVARADRYVDLEHEFGGLLEDLVAARTHAAASAPG
ncbi:MAG TPA: cytochrome c biogenesis protein ResB, partial [Candidatus Limnocylindrales bacterium]